MVEHLKKKKKIELLKIPAGTFKLESSKKKPLLERKRYNHLIKLSSIATLCVA